MSRNSASSESVALFFAIALGLLLLRHVRVERLEADATRLCIETDALQRANRIAKRKEISIRRSLRPESRSYKQHGATHVAMIGSVFQLAEDPGLRQIAVIRLWHLACLVPWRNRHLVVERIDHREEAMQERSRQSTNCGDFDALGERGLGARVGWIGRSQHKLPNFELVAASLHPGPSGLRIPRQDRRARRGLALT